ncbi:hypothetical protein DYB32_001984 [Aphanomyces invadans]|uniref:Uncharacterized protein n=1 Tax=Aphanomyces invadans TaxID=157072 RepID=A0A418B4D1_9STRA|nr:hypothetical protein DYB32_001984 [Aphanomyces invadans]
MLKRKLLAQKMMGESGGDLTIPTFPVKLQHLDPIETKKARDKRRKRDQAARRVAAEKVLLEATKRRQLQADASKAWHRNTTNEEGTPAKNASAKWRRDLLIDKYAIRQHREKYGVVHGMSSAHKWINRKQSFVVVVIKRVPAGNVVTLQLDATSTVKYLYDLYRFNDGATVDHACGRQFYLVLPTTYDLSCCGKINSCMDASQGLFWMDEVVLAASDRTLAVTRGDLTLLDFKLNPTTGASSIATYMMLAVATIHDEKTPAMLAQYIKHNFVVAPLHHVALSVQAAYSDDTASLLSQHRSAAVDAFDVLVDKANQSVMHPVLAVRDKFGIPLGTRYCQIVRATTQTFCVHRYGVTAKEDREYAVELDILLPEDVDVKMEDPATASPGPPRPRRHFHDYLAAQTAAAVWKDMEWRKDARSDKFYGGADLVVAPYYLVRWDCFTQAYVLARGHLVRAKDHLDAYNRLAKPLQTEAIMKPHEIERWTSELESLLRELPATGALTQACRRLQSKAGLLPARAKRYHQALKKSRDDAAKALANHDELPRMSGTEKLKLDFKLREGILSNNFRQLAPDMDVVKERMATVMRNGMGKTKVFAQHVKDNIEILKL